MTTTDGPTSANPTPGAGASRIRAPNGRRLVRHGRRSIRRRSAETVGHGQVARSTVTRGLPNRPGQSSRRYAATAVHGRAARSTVIWPGMGLTAQHGRRSTGRQCAETTALPNRQGQSSRRYAATAVHGRAARSTVIWPGMGLTAQQGRRSTGRRYAETMGRGRVACSMATRWGTGLTARLPMRTGGLPGFPAAATRASLRMTMSRSVGDSAGRLRVADQGLASTGLRFPAAVRSGMSEVCPATRSNGEGRLAPLPMPMCWGQKARGRRMGRILRSRSLAG